MKDAKEFEQLFDVAEETVFFVWSGDDDAFCELHAQLSSAYPEAVVRTIDGASCRTSMDFFNAIAIALDFPDDRVSWNILNERLYDLTWLPARAYLLMVENADQFLVQARDGGLAVFADILDAPRERHFSAGVEPIPRKALFHCRPEFHSALMARLDAVEMRFLVLQSENELASTPASPTVSTTAGQEIVGCDSSVG